MLFISWQALEYKTYEKRDVVLDVLSMEEVVEEEIPLLSLNTPPPPPPPAAVVTEQIKVVEDLIEVEETVIESTEISQEDVVEERIVSVSDVEVAEVDEYVEVPFAIIEDVPVFPGCEGVKKSQRRACFQKMIMQHVSKNFEYPQLALDMGISGRVFVIFTIEKDGSIKKIKTRGPDKVLEKEAHRIVSILPRMTPGKQRGEPVRVPFSLPINFKMK
ncbi:hypothetical protein GCM10022291_32440 [Postechiella marina]|uniref:TonB C-terminal domain-containing protein n=2 Tax=Postechiella marina TaxID=943941 RepID=A0ABP8CGY4_9FLAO